MAAKAPARRPETTLGNRYWLLLAAAGILMALPLSWLSFLLLLFVPGLSLYALIREKYGLIELVTLSFVLSLVLFAFTALATVAFGLHWASYVLGAFAVVVAFYRLTKKADIVLKTDGWPVLLVALAIVALVFLVLYYNTFAFRDGSLFVQPTHACDVVFHLSIIERYITVPQVPPQEPFLPGYDIVYNWLGFVTIGEMALVTGLELFSAYKAIVALTAGLIFLTAYLLAAAVFKNRLSAAFIAAFVFVAGTGLSWAYMLYQVLTGATPDVFYDLVYNWPGVMTLKYDPVSLYFFLPQPQTFALLLMIAGLYMYYVTYRDRSWGFAIASGLTLAALVLFHMMTAFAALIPLGIYFIYLLYRERKAVLGRGGLAFAGLMALPLILSFIAGLYQISLLTENAASHVEIGHHPDVYTTLLFALVVLIPFALYGAWRLWRDEGAALLIIFGLANFVFINVLELPRSMDTYRFLVFLSLPLALLAGYALWELLSSRDLWKKALAVLAILLILPSTLTMVVYYASAAAYQQAPADDVSALQWVKDNTPASAVVFENPSSFPRVSLLSGRVVSYTGQYMDQFHGVNLQWPMEQIMRTTDPLQLHEQLAFYNVSYVFLGSQERGYPFVLALDNTTYFSLAYGDNGTVKVYKVL